MVATHAVLLCLRLAELSEGHAVVGNHGLNEQQSDAAAKQGEGEHTDRERLDGDYDNYTRSHVPSDADIKSVETHDDDARSSNTTRRLTRGGRANNPYPEDSKIEVE